jgi:hypothetical protein
LLALAPDLAVLGLHIGLVLWFAHQTLPHFTTSLIGNYGDTAQFSWVLTHAPWAIFQGETPLLSSRIEAPGGVNLMWNTSVPLLGILAAPVTFLGGPVLGYNIAIITALVANGFVCYLALSRFVSPRLPRLLASLFFAFSPYLVPHAAGHLNLSSVFLVPVLLLLLHELLIRREWGVVKLGVLLGLTLSAQLLISEELVASEAMASAVGVLVLAALFPRRTVRAFREGLTGRILAVSGIAIGVALAITAYPLSVQFFGPRRLSQGVIHKTQDFVTDLGQLWTPIPSLQWSAGLWDRPVPNFTGGAGEFNGYIGIPLMLVSLAIVMWLWRRRPLVRWAAVFACAMTVLSFGPYLHLNGRQTSVPMPWGIVQHVEPFGNLIPARLALYCHLGITVLVAVGVLELIRRTPRVRTVATMLVVGIPVALSVWPASPRTAPIPMPEFFTSSAVSEEIPSDAITLILPMSAEGIGTPEDSAAMVWHGQARFAFPMMDGYWLSPSPTGGSQIGPTRTPLILDILDVQNGRPLDLTDEERDTHVEELRAAGTERVVLGPMHHHGAMKRFMTELLGPPDAHRGGVDIWRLPDAP